MAKRAGCAIFIAKLNIKMGWKLRIPTCSFTTELWGIKKALETLYNFDSPEGFIATISSAVILALKH